jgi:hypothetical protein
MQERKRCDEPFQTTGGMVMIVVMTMPPVHLVATFQKR